MGFVKKRGKRWSAIITDRTMKKKRWIRLPLTISTKREATRAMLQLEDEEERRFLNLPSAMCKQCLTKWLDVAGEILAEIEQSRGKHWYQSCKSFVARFLESQGNCYLNEVTRSDCRLHIQDRLRNGARASNLRKEVIFLSRIFKRAIDDGLLSDNPWNGVERPREPKGHPRFITQEQADRLLSVAPENRRFRYLLLLNTGMRKGEALGLCWRDVDLKQKTIRIVNSQKGSGQKHLYRAVPIPDGLLDELEKRKGKGEEQVLIGERYWTRGLKRDIAAAGIEDFRIHDLRHTYASWLSQSGVTLHQIRDLLGHASVKTTEIYAYLLPGEFDAVVEVLNRFSSHLVAKSENTEELK